MILIYQQKTYPEKTKAVCMVVWEDFISKATSGISGGGKKDVRNVTLNPCAWPLYNEVFMGEA